MAPGLNDAKIRVHQALHGYADGHRLLACSTTLKPRDQKAMLIMSDVSGPNAFIGDAGYLTGYPLTESGVYALACTWAATEMARPGCVWTHTLLLDFADLAVLPTIRFLVKAFRRPIAGFSPGSFDAPIDIEVEKSIADGPEINQDSLKRVVWALYEHPKDRIIASNEEGTLNLVFLLWAQQWPRLRRTFRFCTLAFGDRSGDGGAFDLQFVPARERSVRARFSGLTDAERLRPSPAEWMDASLCDLLEGTEGKLRKFLREVGGDLAGGRETFVPLCRLYNLIPQFADREASIDEAVGLLNSSFDTASANSLRAIFVSALARHPGSMGPRALTFILDHLDMLDISTLQQSAGAIGYALWTQAPQALVRLLHEPPLKRSIAVQGLAKLSTNDLLRGLRDSPQCLLPVLEQRPELIEERDLWKIVGTPSDDALTLAADDPDRAGPVLNAMVAAERGDLASKAVQTFGSAKVLKAVGDWAGEAGIEAPIETLSVWVAPAVHDGETLAEVLSSDFVSRRALLLAIAHNTFPDFVSNNYGEDPWWTSVRHAKGDLEGTGRQYLSAYLLARALGYRSRSPSELIEFAFDDVYLPALHSRLSSEAWSVLEPRLPRSWFFDWDYCQRIRDAFVDAFLVRDLSPVSFTRITKNDDVFAELTRAIGRTDRGRRFLKRALQALIGQSEWSRRADILRNAV